MEDGRWKIVGRCGSGSVVLGMIVVGGEFGVEFNLFSLLTTHTPQMLVDCGWGKNGGRRRRRRICCPRQRHDKIWVSK